MNKKTGKTSILKRKQGINILLIFVAALLIMGISTASFAADDTWNGSGGDNDWSNVANWVGGAAPGAGDVATFDSGAVDCNVSVPTSLGTLDVQNGYSGTITLPDTMAIDTVLIAGGTVTAAGDVTIGSFTSTGGIFNDGGNTVKHTGSLSVGGTYTNTGIVEFDGGGGNFNSGGNTFSTIVITSGTVVLQADLEVDTLTINAGTLDLAGFNLTVNTTYSNSGTLKLNGSQTIDLANDDTDSGTVEYTGGVDATITDTNASFTNFGSGYYNLVITGGANTYTIDDDLTVGGNLTLNTGTLTVDDGDALTVTGDFTQTGGTFNGGDQNIDVGGSVAVSGGTFKSTTAGGNDTGGLEIGGDLTISGGSVAPQGTDGRIGVAGNTSLTGGGTLYDSQEKNNKAGIVITGDLTIDGGIYDATNSGDLYVGGKFHLISGTFNTPNSASEFYVSSDFEIDGGSFVVTANSKIRFTGGPVDLSANGYSVSPIVIQGSATVNMNENLSCPNLSITSGTLNINEVTLTITDGDAAALNVADNKILALNGENSPASIDFTADGGGINTNTSGIVKITNSDNACTIKNTGGTGIYAGADIDYNGNKIYLANMDYQTDVSLAASEQIELSGPCTFDAITINGAGAALIDAGNQTTLSGNYYLQSGSQTLTGTLIMTGNATTIKTDVVGVFGSVSINPGGGNTVSLASAVDINGDLVLTSGTLDGVGEANDINIAGSFDASAGGAFLSSGADVTFDATVGGPYTIHSNGSFDDLTINDGTNGITWQLGAALDVNGNLRITNGTLDGVNNTNDITVYGSFTGPGTFTNNGSDVTFNGATPGTYIISVGGAFDQVTLDTAAAVTWNLGGPVSIGSLTVLDNASFSTATNALTMGGDITHTGTGLLIINGNLTLTADCQITGLAVDTFSVQTMVPSGHSLSLANADSDLSVNNALTLGANDVIAAGDADVDFKAGVILNHANAGLTSTAKIIMGGNFTKTSGSWTINDLGLTSDITLTSNNGISVGGLLELGTNTLTLGDANTDLTINTALTIGASAGITPQAADVILKNDLTINAAGVWTKGTGTLVFSGNTDQTITAPAATDLGAVSITNDSTLNVSGDTIFTSLTTTGGVNNKFIPGAHKITFTGNGASFKMNGGTFNPGDSTIYYTGNTAAVTIPALIFNNLTIDQAQTFTAAGNLDVNGSIALTSGTLDGNGKNITVAENFIGPGTFTNNGADVTFDAIAGGPYTISAGGLFGSVTLDTAAAVTWNLGGPVSMGSLTVSDNASFSTATNALTMGGDITHTGTGLLIINGNLTLTADCQITGLAVDTFSVQTMVPSGHSLSLANADSDLSVNNALTLGANDVIAAGDADVDFKAGVILNHANAGLTSTAKIIMGGNFTKTSGSWTINDLGLTSDITLTSNNGISVGGLLELGSNTLTLGDANTDLTINTALTIGASAGITLQAADVILKNDLTINAAGVWTKGTGTLVFSGNTDQTITAPAATDLGAVSITNDSTLNVSGDTIFTSLTTTGGVNNKFIPGAHKITFTGNGASFKMNGGTFNPGDSTIYYTGNTAAVTIPALIFNNLTIDQAQTFTAAGNLDVNGSIALTSGTLDGNGKNITVAENFIGPGTFTNNGADVTFDAIAGGPYTISAGGLFGSVTLDTAAAVTWNLGGPVSMGSLELKNKAVFSTNGNAFTVGGNITNNSTGVLTINNNFTLSNDCTIDGNAGDIFNIQTLVLAGHILTFANANSAFTINTALTIGASAGITPQAADVILKNDLTINAAGVWTKGTGTLVFSGNTDQTIGDASGTDLGAVSITGDSSLNVSGDTIFTSLTTTGGVNNKFIPGAHKITFTGNGASFNMNGGTFNPGDSTIYYTGNTAAVTIPALTFNNLTIDQAQTFTVAGNLDVNGSIALTAGTLDGNGKNITIAKNFIGPGTFTNNGADVTFDGTTPGTYTISAGGLFGSVTLDTAAAVTWNLGGPVSMGSLTVSDKASFSTATNALTMGGDITHTGTGLLIINGNLTLTADCQITGLAGDTFSIQTLVPSGHTLSLANAASDLTINDALTLGATEVIAAGAADVTFTGGLTLNNATAGLTSSAKIIMGGNLTKTSGSWTINDLGLASDINLTSDDGISVGGTLTLGANTLTLGNDNSDLTINTALTIGASAGITPQGADLILKSDLTIAGTYTKGTGNLIFNGGIVQTLTNSVDSDLGAVILSGGSNLNFGSDIKLTSFTSSNGNTLAPGSHTLTLTGIGNCFAINDATFTNTDSTITFDSNTGDVTFPDIPINNLTINQSHIFTPTSDLRVNGNLTITDGTLNLANDGVGHDVAGNVIIENRATAILDIADDKTLIIHGDFTAGASSRIVAGAGSTVILDGGSVLNMAGTNDEDHDFENLTISSGDYTLTNNLYVDRILSVTNGRINFGANTVTLSGANAQYKPDGETKTTWQAGSSLIIQTNQNHTGANKLPSGEHYGNLTLNRFNAGGTPTFEMGSTINGNWTIGAGVTVNMTENVTVNNGNIIINGTLNTNDHNIILENGNFEVNGGTFNAGTSTVTFQGAGGKHIISGGSDFYNIVINGTAADTWSLDTNPLVAENITITSGTLNANNQSLTVNNNLTIDSANGGFHGGTQMVDINGKFENINGAADITLSSGDMYVAGDFTLMDNGTWDNNTGTLILDGGAGQTVNIANHALHNLENANSAGIVTINTSGGSITIAGNFFSTTNSAATTFSQALSVTGNFSSTGKSSTMTFGGAINVTGDFTVSAENNALVFKDSLTHNIDGTFSIDGKTSGSKVTLRSTAPGTQYRLKLLSQSEAYYADFQDCNIDEGFGNSAGITAYNSLNSGNNDIDKTAPSTGRIIFSTILPGALTETNVKVSGGGDTFIAGTTQTLLVAFTRSNALSAGSKIVVEFPRGFSLENVTATVADINSAADINISAREIQDNRRVVVTLGASMVLDTLDDLQIAKVIVPKTVMATAGQYKFYTTDDGGNIIDQDLFVQADETTQGTGGALTGGNVDFSSLVINTEVEAEVTFRTVNPVPVDGRIFIGFPDEYSITIGNVTVTSASFDGAILSAVGDNTGGSKDIIITRDNTGTQIPAGTEITIKVQGIKNPLNPGASNNITLATQLSGGGNIDTAVVDGTLIGTFTTGGGVTGQLTLYSDAGYSHELDTFKAGDTIYIEVIDGDRNSNNTSQQQFIVDVSSNNVNGGAASDDTDQVTLTETTNTSGVFRGTILTERLWTDLDNNDGTINVVEADNNDTVTVTYSDPLNASGQADPEIKDSARCHVSGLVTITPQRPGLGDNVVITITDQDLNAASGAAGTLANGGGMLVVSTSTGDSESGNPVITLTETGADTGVFKTGNIPLNTAAVGFDNGALNIALGAIITATYTEASQPGTQSGMVHRTTAIVGGTGVTGVLTVYEDSGYTHERTKFTSGETIYFEIKDPNADSNPAGIDTINLRVYSNNVTGNAVPDDDTENVVLTETSNASGVFRGTIATIFSRTATNADNTSQVLEVNGRDSLLLRYEDALNASGVAMNVEKMLKFNSNMALTVPVSLTLAAAGSTLAVSITDQDLNTSNAVDTITVNTLSSTGDADVITLTETGPETGVFSANISAVRGSVVSNNQVLNCVDNGTISITAVDTESITYAGQNSITKNCVVSYQKGYTGTITVSRAGNDASADFFIGETLGITVTDPDLGGAPNVTIASSGGDTETLALVNAGNGIYRLELKPVVGTIPTNYTVANNTFEILPNETITFTYTDELDSIGNVNALRTFLMTSAAYNAVLAITDSTFSQVKASVTVTDPLYFKLVNHDSNMDAAALETVQITVVSRNLTPADVDTETVTLTETGADTGVFTASLPVDKTAGIAGVLQGDKDYTVQASFIDPVHTAGLPVVLSQSVGTASQFKIIELSHNAGATLQITASSTFVITIVDPFRSAAASVNVMVTSSSGDSENITVTGAGGTIFTSAAVPIRYGKIMPGDSTVQASTGDTIRCLYIDSSGRSNNMIISTGSATTALIENYNNKIINGKPAISSGERVYVRIFDPDMNTSEALQNVTAVFTALAANGGDVLNVPLTETGPSTGIFEGSTPVLFQAPILPGSFELFGSGDITVSYNDAFDSLGNANQIRSFAVTFRNDAIIDIKSISGREVITAGETIEISVTDPDLDRTADADTIQVTVISSMGDVEVPTLTETGIHTGVFKRKFKTIKSSAIDDDDGSEEIQVQPGDTISVTYTDTITVNPGTSYVRSDSIEVSQDRLNNVTLSSYNTSTFAQITDYFAGIPQPYQFTFFTTNTLPTDGKITFEFPSGYDLSKTYLHAVTLPLGVDFGQWTISVQGSTMTISRNNDGDPITAGNGVGFYFLNVINPPVTGGTGTFLIRTLDSAGNLIDLSQPIPGVTISQAVATSNSTLTVTPAVSPVLPNTHVMGQEGQCLFSYTNARMISPDNYFKIYFDSQFDISGVKGTSLRFTYTDTSVVPNVNVDITEQMDIAIVANSITLKRRSSNYIPVGATVQINVGQASGADSAVKNPPMTVAVNGLNQFQLYMYTSGDVLLESALSDVPAIAGGRNLTNVSFELDKSQASSYINVKTSFLTEHQIPSDGKIRVTFPQGFDLSQVSEVYAANSALSGNLTYYINTIAGSLFPPNVITLVRSGGKFSNFEITPLSLTLVNVKTPSGNTGGSQTFAIETQTSLGNRIDNATAVQLTGATGEVTITDQNYTNPVAGVIIGSNIYVKVTDIDLNKNVNAIESAYINLRGTVAPGGLGDSVQIELFETGISSEVFVGLASSILSSAAVANNDTLEVKLGESITARYVDVMTAQGLENKERTYSVSTSQVNISVVKYDVTRDAQGNPNKKTTGGYVTIPGIVNNATPAALAVWEVQPVSTFGVTVEASVGLNVKMSVETFSGDSELIDLIWVNNRYEKSIPVIFSTPSKGNGIIEISKAEKVTFTYSENGSSANSANLVSLYTTITPHSLSVVSGDRQRANEGPLPSALEARLISEFNIPVAEKAIEWSALNVTSAVFQPTVLAIGAADEQFMSKSTGFTDANGISSARFKIIKTDETQNAAATYYFSNAELLIKQNLNGATAEIQLFSALYEANQENITIYSQDDTTAPKIQNVHIAKGLQFVPFEAADTVLATSSNNTLVDSITGAGGIKDLASSQTMDNWSNYVRLYVRSFLIFPPGPTTQSVNFQVESKIEQNYQDQYGNIIDGPQELNFDVSGAGGGDDRTGEQKEYYIFEPNPDTPTTFNNNGEVIRLPLPLYFLEDAEVKTKLNALTLNGDYVEKTDNFLKLGIFRFTGVQWELQEFLSYEMVKSGVASGSTANLSNYFAYITAKAESPYTVYTVAKAVDVNVAGSPSELLTGVSLDTNPFTPNGDGVNDKVKISFKLGTSATTTVKIYDSTGELITVLEEGKRRNAGWQDGSSGSSVQWNGRYSWGEYVEPGIYIFEVQAVNVTDNTVSKKSGMIGVVQ